MIEFVYVLGYIFMYSKFQVVIAHSECNLEQGWHTQSTFGN